MTLIDHIRTDDCHKRAVVYAYGAWYGAHLNLITKDLIVEKAMGTDPDDPQWRELGAHGLTPNVPLNLLNDPNWELDTCPTPEA